MVFQTEEGRIWKIRMFNGVKYGDSFSLVFCFFTVQKLEEGLVKFKLGVFYDDKLGYLYSFIYVDDVLVLADFSEFL